MTTLRIATAGDDDDRGGNGEGDIPLPRTGPDDAATDAEILRTVPAKFSVNSPESANWLVRKVLGARHYGERVKLWSEQEQRRAAREEQVLMFLFGRQLEAWLNEETAKLKGRRKSLNLPAGVVGFHRHNPSLLVDDEQLVIRWAAEHCPHAVATVQKLSRSLLKEHFENTGEMPDEGVHIEPSGDRLYIREAARSMKGTQDESREP